MNRCLSPGKVKVKRSYIVVGRRAALTVLRVSPVNLDLKNDRDQEALHNVYQAVLDTVSYPVYIYSRQTPADLDNYVERVRGGEGFTDLRSGYCDYCENVGSAGFVETEHFIVVRVVGGRHDSSGEELYRRVNEVRSSLNGTDFEVENLRGDALQGFTARVFNKAPEPSEHFCATANNGFDEYRKLVYIDGYPSEIEFGWPRRLLRVDGLVDIVQVVRPVDVDTAVRGLKRYSEKLDAEIAAYLAQGHKGVNELERLLDDAEWFMDLLANQECKPVQHGVYITVHGPNQSDVEKTFERVKTRLRTLQLGFQQPGFRNDHAYYTDSPLYSDRLDETFLMPSKSAATALPFGNQPLTEGSGVLYGVDASDRTPILVDRFSWDSHSTAVLGTLGSGKSYFSQLELLRSRLVYPDIRIIVVDPKKEYRCTVEALGGDHRFIAPGKEYSFDEQVVGFEVEERGGLENLAALVDLVRQIYSATSKNRDRTIVLIDEARLLLKDEAGRHALNRFVLEARDINVGVQLVTQNRSHFTDSGEGTEILENIPGKVFFSHEEPPDSPPLSRQEQLEIQGLKTGEEAGYSEAYLHVSDVVNTKIEIGSHPVEHRIIDSDPEHRKPLQVGK